MSGAHRVGEAWPLLLAIVLAGAACDRRYFDVGSCQNGSCDPGSPGIGGSDGGAVGALVAGATFSCANIQHAVYCWGSAPAPLDPAQSSPDSSGASRVVGLSTDTVAAAGDTLCAIANMLVVCAGPNDTGQLGFDPSPDCVPPGNCTSALSSVPGTAGAIGLAVSGTHACAVIQGGMVQCWGANDTGQLGHPPGTQGDRACGSTRVAQCNAMPTVIPGLSNVVAVAVGADATGARGFGCALRADRSVACWGDNTKGQISGDGVQVLAPKDRDVHPPTDVAGVAATALAAGGLSICAIDGPSSRVLCWGDNEAAQGAGSSGVQMFDAGNAGAAVTLDRVGAIAHGSMHTCAVRLGKVLCWGNNGSKQLGRGAMGPFDAPCIVDGHGDYCPVAASPVAGLAGITAIGAAGSHTCAFRPDGRVFCWGSNTFLESGYPLNAFGDRSPRESPVEVQGLP